MVEALVLDLDGALGDTRPLWRDWLASARGVLEIDPAKLPEDRVAAARALDASAAGNWRVLLERYAADRATIYLRPAADVSASLRRLAGAGVRLGVVTDAPRELAQIAVSQLGAARRLEALETGEGALERLRARLGDDVEVVTTRTRLVELAP
jgi:phosphoglycolate phosphatase-like HAD superfamily hydrolase